MKKALIIIFIVVGIVLVDVFIFKDSLLFRTTTIVKFPDWFYNPQPKDSLSYLYAIGISDINEDKMEAFEQADERARSLLSFGYACECQSMTKEWINVEDSLLFDSISLNVKITSHLIERSCIRIVERDYLKNKVAVSLVRLDLYDEVVVMDNKPLEIRYYISEMSGEDSTTVLWNLDFTAGNQLLDTSLSSDQISSVKKIPKIKYKSSKNFGKNNYPEWYYSFSQDPDFIYSYGSSDQRLPFKNGLFSAYLSTFALSIQDISEQIELHYSKIEKSFAEGDSTRVDSVTFMEIEIEIATSNLLEYLFVNNIDFVEVDNGSRILVGLLYPITHDRAVGQKKKEWKLYKEKELYEKFKETEAFKELEKEYKEFEDSTKSSIK